MPLDQSTGDPGGRGALPRRDDDAHAVVAAPSHGAAPGVDHEADQEPDGAGKREKEEKKKRHTEETERSSEAHRSGKKRI